MYSYFLFEKETTMILQELYKNYRILLEDEGFIVDNYNDINYGIQFKITKNKDTNTIRIYSSKKGVKLDLSMVKNQLLKYSLYGLLTGEPPIEKTGMKYTMLSDDISNSIIGTDESGKGDYYGPLVIAGVYTNNELYTELQTMGVMDSKKLDDESILELSKKIKEKCPYVILALDNELYNSLYSTCNNLNTLLAISHMDVIHELLKDDRCKDTRVALIDQFVNGKVLDATAKEAGIDKQIKIEYKTNGESNIAVAAASIIARATFVEMCREMSDKFDISFPKGCYLRIHETYHEFIRRYGEERLNEVSKLHFKLPKSK